MPRYSPTTIKFNTIMGSKIRSIRIKCKLSLKEVALQLGVVSSQYVNIENGKSGTSPENLSTLSKIFSCSMDDIFPSTREMNTYSPESKKEKKRLILQNKIDYYSKQLAAL